MADNDKLVKLTNLSRIAEALDDKFKGKIAVVVEEVEELETTKANIAYVDAEVSRVEDMLDGKSFKYLTQADYDVLSDAEKTDETITYIITDVEALENVSQLVNDANYTSQSVVEEMLGGKTIRYITQADYDILSEEEKNSDSIAYFITDAEELKFVSELINDVNYTKESRVMELLGGKQLRYLTQAEYNALPDAEKLDNSIVYNILDGNDSTPTFEGVILQSPNGSLFKITVDDDGSLITNPYSK